MQLKNLETNKVFNVPDEMAKEFVEKDRATFQIVDKDYKPEDTKVVTTPMFDSVVVKEKKNADSAAVEDFVDDILAEDYQTMSRQELRDVCKLKGIKYNATYGVDKLRELLDEKG